MKLLNKSIYVIIIILLISLVIFLYKKLTKKNSKESYIEKNDSIIKQLSNTIDNIVTREPSLGKGNDDDEKENNSA